MTLPVTFALIVRIPEFGVADFNAYKVSIDAALKLKNKRLSISGQIKVFKKYFSNKVNLLSAIKHIPGKYILQFLKLFRSQLRYYQKTAGPFAVLAIRGIMMLGLAKK